MTSHTLFTINGDEMVITSSDFRTLGSKGFTTVGSYFLEITSIEIIVDDEDEYLDVGMLSFAPNIKHLNLAQYSSSGKTLSVVGLSSLPFLESFCCMSNLCLNVASMATLGLLPNLEHLTLSKVSPTLGLFHLAKSPKLSVLRLNNCCNLSTGDAQAISEIPNLIRLEMYYFGSTTDGVMTMLMQNIVKAPFLTHLKLGSSRLCSESALKELCNSKLQSLKIVSFYNFTDDVLTSFTSQQSKLRKSLRYFKVDGCTEITSSAMKTAVEKLKALDTIGFDYCSKADDSVVRACLRKWRIVHISFEGCPLVTQSVWPSIDASNHLKEAILPANSYEEEMNSFAKNSCIKVYFL